MTFIQNGYHRHYKYPHFKDFRYPERVNEFISENDILSSCRERFFNGVNKTLTITKTDITAEKGIV